jgi:hypothetical protein
MYRIFEPKTEQEQTLVNIIKKSKELKERRKALQELKLVNGITKEMQKEQVGILSIVCHEIYQKIPNSKWYCQKFSHATIKYEDTIIKR